MLIRWLPMLVCASMLAAAHASPKARLHADDVLWVPGSESPRRVGDMVERLESMRAAGQGSEIPAELDNITDIAERHLAAAGLLRTWTAGRSRPEGAQHLLTWALEQPVRLWVRHEETSADWFQPVVDLPALARDAAGIWQLQERRAVWVDAWHSHSINLLGDIRAASPAEQQLAAEALASMEDPLRQEVIGAAVSAPDGLAGAWWSGVVEFHADASTVSMLWDSGDSIQRIDAIDAARHRLDWPSALRLLGRFEQQGEFASAATLALLGRAFREDIDLSIQDALLVERLVDPKRALSAASALARLPESARIEVVQRLLSDQRKRGIDPSARQMLELALQAGGSAADLELHRDLFQPESGR